MDGRRLLILLATLPLLAACLTHLLASPSIEPQVRTPLEPLAFDQYLVNLRQAPLRPTLEADFHFTNSADEAITITKLEPSCGCLQPQLAGGKRTYEPGERGMFRVQVATVNEEPGPHTYTVAVRYQTSEPHESQVRFKMTLPERKVTITPPELAFFQYNGEPSSRDVYLTDFRGDSLEVIGVSSSAEILSVAVQDADVDEAGHHRIPIRLSVPGRVPPGRQMATVTIRTNDPEFDVVRIPVLIDGPTAAGGVQLIGHETPVPPGAEPRPDEPAPAGSL